MTQLSDPSLPAAEIVSTTPTGSVFSILAAPVKKSQKSPLYSAPKPMALAVSMTLAAAQGQQEVRAGPPDQVNALVYLAAAGVGLTSESSVKGCPRPPGRR